MAKIIDPDSLHQGTEVVFDTTNKTFQLLKAGNLSDDGVTGQAFYSFAKEEWLADASLIKFPFPLESLGEEKFEVRYGWTPKDATTINLLRDCGIAVKNTNGTSAEEYIGVITLGTIGASDQVYYQGEIDGTATNIVLTGAANQLIKVYGDATHGNFDNRDYLKVFVRTQAKQYAQASHLDIGVSNFTYQAYRFPLANSDDLKVTHDDTTADAYGVTVTYYETPQARTIGGSSYNFDKIIDGNNKTAEEIYEAVQSLLRKSTDIDSGAGEVIGKTADSLLRFVGDTLVTSTGVFIDDFNATDTNRLEFYDTTGTKRTFPYTAAGTINFNDNLVADTAAIYKMFYTTGFGTASAEIVQNAAGSDISGSISGSSSVSFTYDYDGEGGTDKAVTVVAIGLTKAQYVLATGTITRSTANSISLVSSLERVYVNP